MLRRYTLVLMLALVAPACGAVVTTQSRQQVLVADHTAFQGLALYQDAEEALWHAKAPWPTADQHAANGQALSKAFTLVGAVAQAGLDMKPGQPISASVAQMLADLTTVFSQIVAQSALGPPSIQAKAADAQEQAVALKAAVLVKAR